MNYPYLIHSDQHCHGWTQFSSTDSKGLNTRLAIILQEMALAHTALLSRKGTLAIAAGDLFHKRGEIVPSVFNPTMDTIEQLHTFNPKLKSIFLPGNHDLEHRDASALGNAMQQLAMIPNVEIAVEPIHHGDVYVLPWYAKLDDLRAELGKLAKSLGGKASNIDVVIHAPVNGVIRGIPDTGMEARELASYGFRRVFVGHYHDHKVMEGGKVISIGATTHQTWSDAGSLAGFILVYEDRIEHIESSAPKFMDLHDHDIADEAELAMVATGNYVRLKIDEASEAEIKQYKADLAKAGALGSIVIASNKASKTVSRTGTTVSASTTLEASVGEYVEKQLKPAHLLEVQALCAELISKAREEA